MIWYFSDDELNGDELKLLSESEDQNGGQNNGFIGPINLGQDHLLSSLHSGAPPIAGSALDKESVNTVYQKVVQISSITGTHSIESGLN